MRDFKRFDAGSSKTDGRPKLALSDFACCPRCLCGLEFSNEVVLCTGADCPYSKEGFPTAYGQPVLIDFERSIFDRSAYIDSSGSVLPREIDDRNIRVLLHKVSLRLLNTGKNRVAPSKCSEMLSLMKASTENPVVLVIGGGAIGSGAESLYQDAQVQVVGTDVYASVNTCVLADGHQLPFKNEVFDGVWIQAVLEHVLEPKTVVSEIYRVLKKNGLVYADTPFIQQVHEGAYDFTRFTQSGHRWLFRQFHQIDAGVVAGAGTATIWSIRYFARALGLGSVLSRLFTLLFFWFGFLGRFAGGRENADAASATFFFGRKSESCLSPKDMTAYYHSQC